MTRSALIGMLRQARHVKVGVPGKEGTVYFTVSREDALRKVDELVISGLAAEFTDDAHPWTLWIEGGRP